MNLLINFFASLYDLTIILFSSIYDLIYNFISFLGEYLKWVTTIGSSKSVKSSNSNTHNEESVVVQNQQPVKSANPNTHNEESVEVQNQQPVEIQ